MGHGGLKLSMEAALETDREAHRLIDARAAEALQDQINLADDMVKSLRKAVHTEPATRTTTNGGTTMPLA